MVVDLGLFIWLLTIIYLLFYFNIFHEEKEFFLVFFIFSMILTFFFIGIKEIFGSVKNTYGRICFAHVQSTKYPFVFFEVVIFLFLHTAHFVSFYTFDRVTFFCCVNFIRTRVQRIC